MSFRMISPKGNTVLVEGPGVTERHPSDRVHYAEDGDLFCQVCGSWLTAWTDDQRVFDRSPAACNAEG